MLWRLLRDAFRRTPSADPLLERALTLRKQGRRVEAEACLRQAVVDHPRDPSVATNLAVALLEQDRGPEALPWLERALTIDARFAPAHFNYAHVLRVNGRLEKALPHYRAAAADESLPEAREALMQALMEACDWDGVETVAASLRAAAASSPPERWMRAVSPLTAVYIGLSAERCKAVAAFHAPKAVTPLAAPAVSSSQRIRIAYLSGDFRNHAVAHVLRDALARHDRSRFEVHAYSWAVDDGSIYRRAIEASVDGFVDVSRFSDDEAARAIADAGVDVAIELMGHTTGNRLGILARRPARVQAHYLGYPGTTGASYVDYFVGDAVAIPPELDARFTERVVRVPDCFMIASGDDAMEAPQASRAAHGLPQDAFVFANFGDASRITAATFELWMRILARAPGSLLWLRKTNAVAIGNLRARAAARGIDAARLVFADRVPDKPAHLARLACADLALDTLDWYNGHSTTADLLWAGVPVLTAPGRTFASRVAASLIVSAGLEELAVASHEQYVETAVALAQNRERAGALRRRLLDARATAPFFDTGRLVRGLESAIETMYAGRMRPPPGL